MSSNLWNYPADLWPYLSDAERRREQLERLVVQERRASRRRGRRSSAASRLRAALHLPVQPAHAGR